jgi:CRISPR/Cas system CSM-associated protein Csm3 (group 7 of RAMP superfamily)
MVTIDVTLTFQTSLNVGSGAQRGTLADRAMIKDDRGWPYVPASALKGRLRHAVERFTAGLGKPVCDTHEDMCRSEADACPVCRIFGAPWVPGRLRFERLTLSGPDEIVQVLEERQRRTGQPPRTTHRYGVAISRRRGVAEDALLYTTELFEPGTSLSFSGMLQGPLSRREAALVVAGLRLIPAMGRGKSGGLGWMTSEITVEDEGAILGEDVLRSAMENEEATV